jgi:hypothetical protein
MGLERGSPSIGNTNEELLEGKIGDPV